MTVKVKRKYCFLQKIFGQQEYLSLSPTFGPPLRPLHAGQLDSGQYQQIVRDQCTPNILVKPHPSRPIATREPKRTLQPRDIRLNPSPKILQLLVHPIALHHVPGCAGNNPGFLLRQRSVGSIRISQWDRSKDVEKIQKFLEAKMIRERLRAFGFSQEEIQARLNLLTDDQIHQVTLKLQSLSSL
jgi:hypothetical protein